MLIIPFVYPFFFFSNINFSSKISQFLREPDWVEYVMCLGPDIHSKSDIELPAHPDTVVI